MNSDKDQMIGGVLLLVGIVAVLAIPMVIGQFTTAPAPETVAAATPNQ